MTWRPISNNELGDQINRGISNMTVQQERLWNTIQVTPQKWKLPPWGDPGGGFWIVAIAGQSVVWFNDIENGFNRSGCSQLGLIDEYWCNQDELNWTVQYLLDEIQTGERLGYKSGPPRRAM